MTENMPYASNRALTREYAAWLERIPWQLYCTLTFAWRVSDPQALKTFNSYIDRLERALRSSVTYIRGDEKRFSGCGKPASGRHFHVVMASRVVIRVPNAV